MELHTAPSSPLWLPWQALCTNWFYTSLLCWYVGDDAAPSTADKHHTDASERDNLRNRYYSTENLFVLPLFFVLLPRNIKVLFSDNPNFLYPNHEKNNKISCEKRDLWRTAGFPFQEMLFARKIFAGPGACCVTTVVTLYNYLELWRRR